MARSRGAVSRSLCRSTLCEVLDLVGRDKRGKRLLKFRPMRKLIALSLLAFSICSAATLSYSGTTAGGPTWNRPIAGNPPVPPISGVGTAVRYDVYAFSVDTDGVYSFSSTATSPANWDNYTFLYEINFNPANPFANVLIGNDDNPNVGLSGFSKALTTGLNYYLITTGFGNNDAGSFTNEIRGPGNINPAVPEPTTCVLSGLGLAAFAWSRRRA